MVTVHLVEFYGKVLGKRIPFFPMDASWASWFILPFQEKDKPMTKVVGDFFVSDVFSCLLKW